MKKNYIFFFKSKINLLLEIKQGLHKPSFWSNNFKVQINLFGILKNKNHISFFKYF